MQAYLVWQGGESARYRPLVVTTDDPFQHSIRKVLHGSAFGLKDMGRIRTHVVGLTEGLHNDRVGPSYLQATLEPLLLAILHQRELGGTSVRQMDLDHFLEDHAAAFVRAYAADAAAPKPSPRKAIRPLAGATKPTAGTRAATGPRRRSGTRSRR